VIKRAEPRILNPEPLVLAIETSCDETAVAFTKGYEVLSSQISSQVKVHECYGGVVPELASRKHVIALNFLLDKALKEAKVSLSDVDVIAITKGPGLVGALMVGMTAAKEIALVLEKPIVAVNHIEAHIFSIYKNKPTLKTPFLCLVVSGGHTMLVYVESLGKYRVLGETLDDAAGEAFDKVAKFLGYPYPGGPQIEKASIKGDEDKYDLPRPMIDSKDYRFSFSGLKTALIYKGRKLKEKGEGYKREDLAASFQKAVVEVLAYKAFKAAKEYEVKSLAVVGGVASNTYLREYFEKTAKKAGIEFILPEKNLSTDNAVMVGFAASYHYKNEDYSNLKETVSPNLRLPVTTVSIK